MNDDKIFYSQLEDMFQFIGNSFEQFNVSFDSNLK